MQISSDYTITQQHFSLPHFYVRRHQMLRSLNPTLLQSNGCPVRAISLNSLFILNIISEFPIVINHLNMWKFAASVIDKFSGLTPLKAFLKYIFQRISNDFLDHQPNIDFRKGQLELNDLPLSAKKINETFLMSSPYIMHSGVIRKLKIILPNILELASKSIEVEVSGLELVFYPNKYFLERFNEQMKQMKENSKFYDVEDNVRDKIQFKEDDSLDFFKQIIKQVLTNIKVNVSHVCIKVFMNTPSENKNNPKPQFYSMLRVPSIVVERAKSQESTEAEDVQKYMLKIPQITTHLLREDLRFPQYENVQAKQTDFPYIQPTASHPSTLILIGNKDLSFDAQSILLFFTVKKELKTRTKKFLVKGAIPNIEFMLQPFQIKVLQKFLSQLDEFKKLYHYSMSELRRQDSEFFNKINDVSRDFSVRDAIRMTTDLHSSMDIFSSIMMSFEENYPKEGYLRRSGYFDSLMEENNKGMSELKAGLGNFNRQLDEETKAKIKEKMETGYSTTVKTNIDIGFIKLYLLKHNSSNTLVDYERVWTSYLKNKPVSINEHIPCSYFMINIKQINIESDDKEMIAMSIKKVVLLNVRLANNKTLEQFHESEDIFHSFQTIEKSRFTNSQFKDSSTKHQGENKGHGKRFKKLVQFEKSQHQHYCASYVLWITVKDPERAKTKSSKHIYCPSSSFQKTEADLFSFGVNLKVLKAGTKESKTYIGMERVGVFLDLEIAKDLVNIVYPLFTYRNLIESINLKKQELNSVLEPRVHLRTSNLAYSRYDLTVSPEFEEVQEPTKDKKVSKSKEVVELSVKNISLSLTDLMFEDQRDLVENEKSKVRDGDSFASSCFCEYHLDCLTAEINKFKVRVDNRTKIAFKNSYLWVRTLSDSKPNSKVMVMGTPSEDQSNRVFIESIKDNPDIQEKVCIHIPLFKVNVEKKECLKFIAMAEKLGRSYKEISTYVEYLSKEFRKIDASRNIYEAKAKKAATKSVEKSIVLHFQNFQATVLDLQLLISNLVLINEPKQTSLKANHLILLHMHKYHCLLKSVPIDIKENLRKGSEIDTSTVVCRLSSKGKEMEPFTIETKDKDFFHKLQSNPFSLSITVSQSQEKVEQNTKVTDLKSTGKFGFMKRKQLETISEEEDQQIISISLNQPLLLRPCQLKNYLGLKQDIQEIHSIIHQSKLIEILTEPAHKRRKDSDWSPRRKVRVNLRLRELFVDLFPYEDLKQSSSILSSTRSYFTLENISVQIESSEKSSDFGECVETHLVSLEVKKSEIYFLYFNDTDPAKNPLLIMKEDLINYGFRRVAAINSVSSTILHQHLVGAKQPSIELTLRVDSIDGECSSMTTVYLQHHLDTVVRMTDYFSELFQKSPPPHVEVEQKQEFSDEEVELIQQESMKREEELKGSEQSEFKSRTVDFLLTHPQNMTKSLALKQLEIKRISFSLYSGDDFCFAQGNQISQESIYEINDKNEVIYREDISPNKVDSKKRFRKKDVDKYTNMRFVAQGVHLELCKYKLKNPGRGGDKSKEKGLNIRAVFKVRTINWIMNKMGEDIFYLLKTTERISIIFQIEGTKIKAKHFLPESIQVGYTSNLNFWWSEREQAKTHLSTTAYLIPFEEPQEITLNLKQIVYQILAFVPKTKLIINLQMIGWKVLTNQQISTVQLFFHSRLSKYLEEDNNKIIMRWITDILTNNMGSILANTFLGLFSKAIWFFLSCIKHIIIFPGKIFRGVLRK